MAAQAQHVFAWPLYIMVVSHQCRGNKTTNKQPTTKARPRANDLHGSPGVDPWATLKPKGEAK